MRVDWKWAAALAVAGATALVAVTPARAGVPLEGEGGPRWKAFLGGLTALEQGRREAPLRILQLGDSHTAGDHFSHALRSGLQARFGDAGAGWLQPGKVRYYRSSQVLISQSAGWNTINSFGDKERKLGNTPYGLGGFTNLATQADNRVDYELKPRDPAPRGPARLELYYQGAADSLRVSADGQSAMADETSVQPAQDGWRRSAYLLPNWPASFSVETARDGQTALVGTVLESTQPGVVVDSIGIAGARASIALDWSEDAMASQLGGRDYELIVLAFGTNEAYHPWFEEESYRQGLEEVIERLSRLAPRAALILVAPPDAERKGEACKVADRKGRRPPEPTQCSVSPAKTCAWEVPAELAVVRKVQREVARRHGALYWDWSAVMGGACGNHRWGREEPRRALPDHVHLSNIGYAASGEALLDAILARYGAGR